MNGSIENFNGWFDEKFWAKETFTNLEDMRAKSTHFVGQYNDLSAWKKRNKSLEQINPARILINSLKIPLGKLPLTKGKIHFIRMVDNEGKISVLNEAFKVGKEGTIDFSSELTIPHNFTAERAENAETLEKTSGV